MHSDRTSTVVALVGAPNSGKTTLFNWMSGARFRAVNYPGATVDCFRAETQPRYGLPIAILDTPGTYSLFPKSPEEEVTRAALFENRLGFRIHQLVVVVDATQLDRHLYFVRQLKEAGFDMVIALTMVDLLKRSGKSLDTKGLSQHLGVPIVEIDGRLGGGIPELISALHSRLENTQKQAEKNPSRQRLPAWSEDKS